MVLKSVISNVSKIAFFGYIYIFDCAIEIVERKVGGSLPEMILIFALPYPPGLAV